MNRPWSDGDGGDEAALDERVLMEAASGDLTEAASLTSLFFQLAMEQFGRMREALAAGDHLLLAQAAHLAAGGAATCGLCALASALRAVETAAADTASADALERAGREFTRARAAVRSFLGEGETG